VQKIPTDLLSLAGEYRVCSELIKRGVFATITYGNRKSVDVFAIGDRKRPALKIEVKTNQTLRGNFVTSITQKGLYNDPEAPDFWVLFQMQPSQDGKFKERFFILTHAEICRLQRAVNGIYSKKFFQKHGKQPDLRKGVDNVTVADVEKSHEDAWEKIVNRVLDSSGRTE